MKKILISLLLVACSLVGFSQSLYNRWLPASGTDTYAVNITSFTTLSNSVIYIKFANANTGASTITINTTLGPAAIRKWDGDSWEVLIGGEIDVNTVYKLSYSGSYYELEGLGAGGGGGGSGTVTNVTGSTPIVITGTSTITPNVTITNAAADGSTKGAASFTASDFDASSGNIGLDYTNGQAASGSNKGFLTSSDWTAFNNKQAAISFGTGVVTALGLNVGTAGAFVINGGALGTPSSGVGTNITGIVGSNVTNTPAGGIAATNSQAAINELDTEKQAALVSGTNIKTVGGTSLLGSGNVTEVVQTVIDGVTTTAPSQDAVYDALVAAGLTQATVTEVKNYYYGEFRVNRLINTSTGATTASNDYDVTDFIEIEPSTSIKIYTHDGTDIRLYGWTYDANFTAISEFRSNALLTTLIDTYTFTTPSNAKYIQLYTRYTTGGPWSIVNRGWANVLRIESTSTHTYASPILPEQFAGSTDAEKIQAAFDFQRWTTSAVQTNGNYLIDTTLFIYSNTNWINSGRLKMADGLHNNLFRNEAAKYPSNIRIRGNRNITISGSGVFEGADEEWGGLPASGVGSEWWRSIMCLLANVEIFSVNNVQTKDPAAWAWSLESCRFGTIDGLYFNHDLSENNQDGLNFRFGNHDIGAINLRGTTGDDLFAITLLPDFPLAHILGVTTVYDPAETTNNTHDITIRDSFGTPSRLFSDEDTPVFSTGGLLLVEDGAKIYNVGIDNVSGLGQIRIGVNDSPYWATTPATVNDIYNISITNTSIPIQIRQPLKNSSFINISRLDRFNVTGSAAIPEGSLNITRKYKDKNLEFFPTVPTFDPLDIADLEIWYDVNDAATITKSSNLVSQMTDKSGNGHTVSEATNKPLWVDNRLGNKPVIEFDGVNDALRSALIPELQGITAFTAFLVGNNGTPLVWHGEDFANRTEIIGGSTPSIVVSNAGNASGAMTATGILSGTGMRIDGIYNGGASGNANRAKLMLTSDPKTLTFTGTIPATTENNASSSFAIGVIDNASPVYFHGEFAEFLFFTRVLTADEIADVQAYLSSKWGL